MPNGIPLLKLAKCGDIQFMIGKFIRKMHHSWWINRIIFLYNKVDIIRIDHFNGFAKYWEIPRL